MTLLTQEIIDQKWLKDSLTNYDVSETKFWQHCAVGNNLDLSKVREYRVSEFLRWLDKKLDTRLKALGDKFNCFSISKDGIMPHIAKHGDEYITNMNDIRMATYREIQIEVKKIKKYLKIPQENKIDMVDLMPLIEEYITYRHKQLNVNRKFDLSYEIRQFLQ